MTSHLDDIVLRSILGRHDVTSLTPPPLKNPAYATAQCTVEFLAQSFENGYMITVMKF